MATIKEARYTTQYTGLVSTASLAVAFIVLMTAAYEVFPRLRRDVAAKRTVPSVEDYTMGYLYRPRFFFMKGPMSRRPFGWIAQALRPQTWFFRHTGLDSAVYVRFVEGCWYFMASQVLTTAVVLIPLHISYAPDSVLPSSLARASVTSLIDSTSGGRDRLWVHTVLLYWQSICWITVMAWVGWGNIRMRREQILYPMRDCKPLDDEVGAASPPGQGHERGRRFRTVKVSNIPPHMRNEGALRSYFDSCLSFIRKGVRTSTDTVTPVTPVTAISSISLVRRLNEVQDLVKKRRAVLLELEGAHVLLSRNVLEAVKQHVRKRDLPPPAWQSAPWKFRLPTMHKEKEPELDNNLDYLTEKLWTHLRVDSLERQACVKRYGDTPENLTIWESLSQLPPKILDRYQPIVKLQMFRGQVAPSIDYNLTKFNLLTSLVDDLRAKPESYAATDTAFVTFNEASDARLVRRELSWIRTRDLTCRVGMAPDVRDLDWSKLAMASFRSTYLRGFIIHTLVWIATIVWIIPVGALIGLVSIDNLSTRIPALANWLDGNPKAKSLASSLIPTVMTVIVNMLVPTIIIQVSGRGQTFVTLSKLHHATWCRYWKWAVINIVIAFCAGTALFTSLLGIFTGESLSDTADNPLNVIASSFSNGAIFFVSYTILIIGTQCFFELAQFMIPWFLYLGVRKATTPRARFQKTEPRRFFAYTIGPNHTLVIAIILVFSLLNPLPICFVFVYFTCAVPVFKDHFARVYWRAYYEQHGRLFYPRLMRFSLDALTLGQVVNMALFFVLKDGSNGGACAALIPITVITKLILTRWYDQHMDAADAAFADAVCRNDVHPDAASILGDAQPQTSAERRERRKAVNTYLSTLRLPELTIKATLKLPLTRGPKVLRASKGPQAVVQRLAQHLQKSDNYAKLRSHRNAETTAAKAEHTVAAAEKALDNLQTPGFLSTPKSTTRMRQKPEQKVLPHAKVSRDDRSDYSAPYTDPCLSGCEGDSLWLPRDPLYDIDLDDSIDWFGRAIVSSEGGDGAVGEWRLEEPETFASEGGSTPHGSPKALDSALTPTQSPLRVNTRPHAHSSGSLFIPPQTAKPTGIERVEVAPDVARRAGETYTQDLAESEQLSAHAAARPPLGRSVSEAPPAMRPQSAVSNATDVSQGDLRRTQSEHVLHHSALGVPPVTETMSTDALTPTGRDRSATRGTTASERIKQSRALAHEVLEEERQQALERRKVQEQLLMEASKPETSTWSAWLRRRNDEKD